MPMTHANDAEYNGVMTEKADKPLKAQLLKPVLFPPSAQSMRLQIPNDRYQKILSIV